MTTLNQARERITQQFLADWGTTTPVDLDNEAFTPPAGTEWVRMVVRHASSSQDSLGGIGLRKFERVGSVLVQVFSPLDKGQQAGDNLAHQARSVFEGKTFNPEAIHFFAVAVRDIGASEGWHQTNVDAAFIYYETK